MNPDYLVTLIYHGEYLVDVPMPSAEAVMQLMSRLFASKQYAIVDTGETTLFLTAENLLGARVSPSVL